MIGYKTPEETSRVVPDKSTDVIRHLLRVGRIDGVKISRSWMIPDSEVKRLQQEAEAANAS